MPDTEGGGWAADVGFGEASGGGGEAAGSYAGVDADAYLLGAVGEGLAEAFELRNGAVSLGAEIEVMCKLLFCLFCN